MAWFEVYDHAERAVRHEGKQLVTAYNASCFSDLKPDARGGLMSHAVRLQGFSWLPERSIYDGLSRLDRMMLIGSAVSVAGDKWLVDHPRQSQWLMQEQIAASDCVKLHEEHYQTEMQDPFWQNPNRKKKGQVAPSP